MADVVVVGGVSMFWALRNPDSAVCGSFMTVFVLRLSVVVLWGWDMLRFVFETRSAIIRLVSEMIMWFRKGIGESSMMLTAARTGRRARVRCVMFA